MRSENTHLKCNRCYKQAILTEKKKEELNKFGRVTISCKCGRLYTIEDDGDSLFVKGGVDNATDTQEWHERNSG